MNGALMAVLVFCASTPSVSPSRWCGHAAVTADQQTTTKQIGVE
jgi:hypothetical protein